MSWPGEEDAGRRQRYQATSAATAMEHIAGIESLGALDQRAVQDLKRGAIRVWTHSLIQ